MTACLACSGKLIFDIISALWFCRGLTVAFCLSLCALFFLSLSLCNVSNCALFRSLFYCVSVQSSFFLSFLSRVFLFFLFSPFLANVTSFLIDIFLSCWRWTNFSGDNKTLKLLLFALLVRQDVQRQNFLVFLLLLML